MHIEAAIFILEILSSHPLYDKSVCVDHLTQKYCMNVDQMNFDVPIDNSNLPDCFHGSSQHPNQYMDVKM